MYVDENEETMSVSVVDANHCPGAVMYLFEVCCSLVFGESSRLTAPAVRKRFSSTAILWFVQGYFGRVLYTGDFRFRDEMFADWPLACLDGVDLLFLDNTYCEPHCAFPPRHEALQRIIHLIEQHPGV